MLIAVAGCGSNKNIQGHHPDYDKPLDVIWLCPPCHRLEHLKLAQLRRKKFNI